VLNANHPSPLLFYFILLGKYMSCMCREQRRPIAGFFRKFFKNFWRGKFANKLAELPIMYRRQMSQFGEATRPRVWEGVPQFLSKFLKNQKSGRESLNFFQNFWRSKSLGEIPTISFERRKSLFPTSPPLTNK